MNLPGDKILYRSEPRKGFVVWIKGYTLVDVERSGFVVIQRGDDKPFRAAPHEIKGDGATLTEAA